MVNIWSIVKRNSLCFYYIFIITNFLRFLNKHFFFATSACFSWWAVIRCWKFFSSRLSRNFVAHFQNLTYYTFFDLKEWSISSNFSFTFYNYYNKIFIVFQLNSFFYSSATTNRYTNNYLLFHIHIPAQ